MKPHKALRLSIYITIGLYAAMLILAIVAQFLLPTTGATP